MTILLHELWSKMLDDGVDKVGDTPTVTTTRAPAMLKIVVILAEVVGSKI